MNILSTHRASANGTLQDAATGKIADQQEALQMAAEQFEAMFLQQVLKQMRKANDALASDSSFKSNDMETMRDLHDSALAESLASQRQTGIADMIVKQLSGAAGAEAMSVSAAQEAARDTALPERASLATDGLRSFESRSSLDHLRTQWQRGVEGFNQLVDKGSRQFQTLVDSVIRQESGGRVDAVSNKGALGLMQLMPSTARDMANELGIPFSVAKLTRDGQYNKTLGSEFLNKMLVRYDGDSALALAAYNAGPARVDEWLVRNGDPRRGEISSAEWVRQIPFKETRDYATRILADMGEQRASLREPAAFKSEPVPVALQQLDEVKQISAQGRSHDARSWQHLPVRD